MSDPIWVELVDDRRYPVEQVPGGPVEAAAVVDSAAHAGRLLVVTDDNVRPLHTDALVEELRRAGREVRCFEVAAGEGSKSPDVLVRLWNEALAGPLERTDTVVAVGGGVVGDLGGFVASTLLRGIDVVQVATTVLAMADAAVGGKTGINLPAGKNLAGTFHQPRAVVQWTGALATLPDRERRSGIAEVVKSALLAGESELAWLESHGEALDRGDIDALTHAVRMAAGLKAKVVAADEREAGRRRLLNLGHTLGHVIEHALGYGAWTHGEAVSAGIVLALELGLSRGIGDRATLDRTVAVLQSQKLPVSPPSLTLAEWTGPLSVDKKRAGETILFVVCDAPGACRTVPVPLSDVVDWLSRIC